MQKVEEPVTDQRHKRLCGFRIRILSHARWMPITVDRSKERSASLHKMRTDEAITTPILVVACISIEMELCEQGFPPAKAMYAHREEDFTTGELYDQWASVVLFYLLGATQRIRSPHRPSR
jgi:hypothetical protein